MALPASDTFLQTSGTVQALEVYNPSWTIGVGGFSTLNNGGFVYSTGSGLDCLAWWDADAFANDHFSQVTFQTGWAAIGRYAGPAARCSGAGASAAGYGFQTNNSGYSLGRVVGGSWTTLQTGSQAWADGDVCRMEVRTVSGSTVRVTIKRALAASPTTFTTVLTYDDTNAARLLSGSGGITGYDSSTDPSIGFWEADDLAAEAPAASASSVFMSMGVFR